MWKSNNWDNWSDDLYDMLSMLLTDKHYKWFQDTDGVLEIEDDGSYIWFPVTINNKFVCSWSLRIVDEGSFIIGNDNHAHLIAFFESLAA